MIATAGTKQPIRRATIPVLMLKPEEAAASIGISRRQFFKMCDAGLIGPKGVRFGTCLRFPLDEWRRWIAAGCPRREDWPQT